AIADDLQQRGLAVHEVQEPTQNCDFLGLSLREGRWLGLRTRDIWRVRAAIRVALRRRRVSGFLALVLTGRFTWALLIRREMSRVLGATNAVIQVIRDLLPLCSADLCAPWRVRVAGADASPWGSGVVARRAPKDLVGAAGRVAGTWRYKVERGARARARTVGVIGQTDVTTAGLGDSLGFDYSIFGDVGIEGDEGFGSKGPSLLDLRPPVDFEEVPAHFIRGGGRGSIAAVHIDCRANILALKGEALVLG
ncbi:unnamed protein product, partial [Prorocentrum cordatum]